MCVYSRLVFTFFLVREVITWGDVGGEHDGEVGLLVDGEIDLSTGIVNTTGVFIISRLNNVTNSGAYQQDRSQQ